MLDGSSAPPSANGTTRSADNFREATTPAVTDHLEAAVVSQFEFGQLLTMGKKVCDTLVI